MYLTVDPDSSVPIAQQIHDGIVAGIVSGELQDGQPLLSVRRLAVEYGVNPATVKKAYDQLQEDGLVHTAARSGTVITRPKQPSVQQRERLREDLRATVRRALAQGFNVDDICATIDDLAVKWE
ncbi:GntR family transcriptional regulator [uncultured Corynebacterium sp.]|uniref:GntR family transcriptional regulator n=1 Tax=uncultured Corynebacterium sp. TaxID=159447 RepID=UPI0025F4F864|nr:GntR family transcriptional regulator [uncultured Corynebacterium sp.]